MNLLVRLFIHQLELRLQDFEISHFSNLDYLFMQKLLEFQD
jgi:hypothetical protein